MQGLNGHRARVWGGVAHKRAATLPLLPSITRTTHYARSAAAATRKTTGIRQQRAAGGTKPPHLRVFGSENVHVQHLAICVEEGAQFLVATTRGNAANEELVFRIGLAAVG
jgi:hypothetical protein